MKIYAPLIFCCLFISQCFCQHVYTVRNGAWEDSSTWYKQIRPQTTGDSIFIYHQVSLDSNLYLFSGYLEIDTTGSLCGNNWLVMDSGCYLYNAGFLGLYGFYSFEISGQNVYTGIIDLGEGEGSFNGYVGEFINTGCISVHNGPERCLCLNDSTLNTYLDSTINIGIDRNIISADMDTDISAEYNFYFGDGTTEDVYGPDVDYHVIHQYTDTGYYPLMVIITGCCFNDTLQELIYIDYKPAPPPPPPPPPCDDTFGFRFGPSPANYSFALSWQFCDDEQVTVKLYTLNGQLVLEQRYNTVAHVLNESIDTYFLPGACYMLSAEASSGTIRKMMAVVHDY